MSSFTGVAEQAARAGGRVLLELLGQAKVREKGPKDLVTEADTKAQQVIRQILQSAFPDHQFVGEEDPGSVGCIVEGAGSADPRLTWVVDPLDGTANFVHQLPGFSVSVGLVRGNELLAGVVYDPTLDECFTAERGAGTFLNGQPLRVSQCDQLARAMVAVSFPPNVSRESPDIPRFTNVLVSCQSLRRMGSAALNLSYLAAGRLDAYWATSCKPWDVAAGILLVRESGGVVTNMQGEAFALTQPQFVATATRALHRQLLAAFDPVCQ